METQIRQERLRKFALVTKTDIFCERSDGTLEFLGGFPDDNPAAQCPQLRQKLKSGAKSQKVPCIMKDGFDVFFACFRTGEEEFYYAGPMSMARLSPVSLRKFYRSYGIYPEDVRSLQVLTLQEILYIAELIEEILFEKTCKEEELLRINGIAGETKTEVSRQRTSFLLEEEYADDMEETWRHTYRQERRVMDAIREGRAEDALKLSYQMDDDAGRLSDKELEHWKSLATVVITLCSRAAIEAGLAPGTAYRISGYYIQKCNKSRSNARIIHLRDEALREFAGRVKEKRERQRTSNYTETCKNYVARHYREKIYLEDAAGILGISASYLSHLFKKDTGICFQDYVNQVRCSRAANLLRYSDMGLTAIAEYVGFPSQSYFGKIFKACTHMTPREYRDRFKAAEWAEEQNRQE